MRRALIVVSFLFPALALAQTAARINVVPVEQDPMHTVVLENAYVRVFLVEVPPHGETQSHRHDRDFVYVTLGDTEVESERFAQKAIRLSLKDGEAHFTKGGFAHRVKNLSGKPSRNVVVEFKAPVDHSGKHLYECIGVCMETVVDSKFARCDRRTGTRNRIVKINGGQPVLVIRAAAAEFGATSSHESLISFHTSPEGATIRGGEEKTDFTACTFSPLPNEPAK